MADNGGRIIRDSQENPNPEVQLARRRALIAADQTRFGKIGAVNARVLPPYFPREPMMAGDPASPGGTKVTLSELADDVLAALAAGGSGGSIRVREVDGSPDIDPTTVITVPNGSLTPGGPGEAILDFGVDVVVDFNKIVVAKFTDVFSAAPPDEFDPPMSPGPEAPLVVIDNAGNVVVAV
jgi:hypothetical protein